MLQLISQQVTARNGTIVIQGDTQEEVLSPAARQLAINTGTAAGLSRCGTSGNDAPYPVDSNGQSNEDLIFGRNGAKVAGYRVDFRVSAGL